MATARSAPSVLLNSGKVLVAGGYTCDGSGNCSSLSSAEIYDPGAGIFSSAGTMTVARSGHTMTVLGDGTVLIAGGQNCASATSCTTLSSAEIYDPIAGTFTSTLNGMNAPRFGASAVLVNTGLVVIVGGFDGTNLTAAAEIYQPAYLGVQGRFTYGGGPSLNVPRFDATATLLNNGQVLVAGGSTCALPGCPTNAAELYDAVADTFTLLSGGMNVPRFNHSATLTTNGQVVIAGGFSSCGSSCTSEASTEFFDPVAGIFTSGPSVAYALAGHTGTLLANGNVLLTGGINAGVTLASDESYQPIGLTPSGLVSISVAPASLFLIPGQTQQFVATGTFLDGSTQTLQSVIWNSSNPAAASISNSTGSAGLLNAQATGATTLTATAGNVIGSASLNVAGLISLAITPPTPSITVGSGQQFTATGTFPDGSQHDLTRNVTWNSSNSSVVLIASTPGFQGFAAGVASGTATITATLGSTSAITSVTVQISATINPPSIISVSPPNGAPGRQVTISGSGFGTTQGSGTVWLGSTYGGVVSWTNTQIVATVAAISQSGTAQVQQNGLSSNAVSFNVNTATILNVSPASGVPGTQVTIAGSGFGATQGSGQVWLGTANGIVISWSDTQVVAEVASGSMSGWVQVLQNGVWSNYYSPFSVDSLYVASVTPTSGGPGTSVTITGTGFGSTQGSGQVWLGGTNGDVMSWSDTQVVAAVAPSALTGVVRMEQNGVWSNAISFTVPNSGANAVTLIPNMLNLVVGQTQTLQALNASSQPVSGLTWSSSNPKVVSLSTDDPPILTALTAGHITITAGTASADVTVFPGTLPTGTVIWSNPGDGSGVQSIVPAVPSSTGIADVFAFQADGTVQAITSSGATAWTANLNGAYWWNGQTVPDFQGGMVVANFNSTPQSIYKLDGITGQAYPAYTPATQNDSLGLPLVHTDGTIFTVDTSYASSYAPVSVIGINPTTGTQKFSVPLDQSTSTLTEIFSSNVQDGECDFGVPGDDSGTATYSANQPPTVLGPPIIAGDGYLYLAYTYQIETGYSQQTVICEGGVQVGGSNFQTRDTVAHLTLLRVGSDGSFSNIDVQDWESSYMDLNGPSSTIGFIPTLGQVQMITNADQGVLLTWEASWDTNTYGLAVTAGGRASSTTLSIPGQIEPVRPVLQTQDGTFLGYALTNLSLGIGQGNMIAFDSSGNIKWIVPNDYPGIATADGGVIGSSGITYDSNGNATGQIALPIQSWTGNGYQYGSTDQVVPTPTNFATTLWAQAGANPSGQSTAARPWYFKLVWQNAFSLYPDNPQYLPNLSADITFQAATIKSAALAALKQAYAKYPVNVSEGADDSTGDNRANIVNGINSQGGGSESCGLSSQFPNSHDSNVYYLANMEQAQWALPIVLNTSKDVQKAAGRVDLMNAIGTGIGNTAAHEIAHQFLLDGYGMDDSSSDTYNGQGCDGSTAPWVYTGTNGTTPIHWEAVTDQALQNALKGGGPQ